MPRRPKRPCSHPGCPELVEGRFCKAHEKAYNQLYEKYRRDPKTHKRYGRVWKKIRARYIKEHPLCEMCLKETKAILAEEVHHVLPLSRGGTHDERNLMSLCKSCHSTLHAKSGERFGR